MLRIRSKRRISRLVSVGSIVFVDPLLKHFFDSMELYKGLNPLNLPLLLIIDELRDSSSFFDTDRHYIRVLLR